MAATRTSACECVCNAHLALHSTQLNFSHVCAAQLIKHVIKNALFTLARNSRLPGLSASASLPLPLPLLMICEKATLFASGARSRVMSVRVLAAAAAHALIKQSSAHCNLHGQSEYVVCAAGGWWLGYMRRNIQQTDTRAPRSTVMFMRLNALACVIAFGYRRYAALPAILCDARRRHLLLVNSNAYYTR